MLKPLSVQLYSLRDYAKDDFVTVLKKVAEIGYKGVEPAGFWDVRPSELKKIVEDLGGEDVVRMKLRNAASAFGREHVFSHARASGSLGEMFAESACRNRNHRMVHDALFPFEKYG